MLLGIDVSDRQGTVDWPEHAEAGVGFAFARATEGVEGTDPRFARNWDGMGESGLVRGAYHVASPAGDPVEQARHFVAVIGSAGGLSPGDLVALDLERDDGLRPQQVARHARRWCHQVESHLGVRPFVHTFHAFARDGNCAGLAEHPLWISAPGRPRGRPAAPRPWRAWSIHQYAHSPIDLDLFPGSREELASLGFHPR